jgi:hypothetical protein
MVNDKIEKKNMNLKKTKKKQMSPGESSKLALIS